MFKFYEIIYMTYKGRFKPKNPDKYRGDTENIVYRSLWERNTFRWLDENDSITEWASEEFFIPYLCATDKRMHKYYVDVWFKNNAGEQYIVEIKPKKETAPPKNPGRRTRKFISESLTYIKNQSKWEAAQEFAIKHNMKFVIWTEDTLKSLGIKILK
jgi:hypothetical protein